MAKTNGTGQTGKSFQDRELAATVRSLALGKIKIILERPTVEMSERDKELHDAILIRMSSSLLPRLNAGRDENEQLYPIPIFPVTTNENEGND